MPEGFNIKEGFFKLLKKLIYDEEFINLLVDLLLGKVKAADALKAMFLRASHSMSLNEMVAAHRLCKSTINEGAKSGGKKDPGLIKKLLEFYKKGSRFKIKAFIKALGKPGVPAAIIKLIASEGTSAAAWAVVAKAVLEAAVEVASEDEEMQVSLAEGIEPNGNSVNIMVGRFQPFTLGHLKCLHAIKNSLGVPTLICVIPGNGDPKHPFTGEVQDEMLERLESAYPDVIAGIKYVKNAFIESWVLVAKDLGLEPVSWTCGNDRIDAYRSMVEKHGEKYGLPADFEVHLVDRADDNISATSVRECLENGDREGFMRQMPDCLHDMYDEMRAVMVGETEPAQSLAEDKEYFEYRKRLDEAITRLVKGNK